MGLDMTAYSRAKNTTLDTHEQDHELMYWRKHNAMHGLMNQIWESKDRPLPEGFELREGRTVKDIDFNCIELELTVEDVDMIEKLVMDQELPETSGFFFGHDSRFDNDDYDKDVEFIRLAREAFKRGDSVYYNSWW